MKFKQFHGEIKLSKQFLNCVLRLESSESIIYAVSIVIITLTLLVDFVWYIPSKFGWCCYKNQRHKNQTGRRSNSVYNKGQV